ncbi:MAG: PAS domain-containing protein [Nanoarchaeota archaeon]
MADEESFDARAALRRFEDHIIFLERERAQLQKKTADLEERLARQQNKAFDADTESRVKRIIHVSPKVILDERGNILFANEPYTALTGYELPEIRDNAIGEHIAELQQILQIHPALLALENLSCYLDHIPVTVRCKEKKDLALVADINFGSSDGKGYHGAEIFLGQRHNGLGTIIFHILHRHQHTLTLNVHDPLYAHEGVLTYQTLETSSPEPVYQQPLFNAIIGGCLGISRLPDGNAIETIVVDFHKIKQCDEQIYRIFGKLSKLDLAQREQGLKIQLARVKQEIASNLIKEGFPKEYIREIK